MSSRILYISNSIAHVLMSMHGAFKYNVQKYSIIYDDIRLHCIDFHSLSLNLIYSFIKTKYHEYLIEVAATATAKKKQIEMRNT